MSIESIEVEDIDGNDTDGQSKSALHQEDTYNTRIKHFDKSYKESHLRRDPSSMENLPAQIAGDFESQVRVHWCYEFQLLAERNMLN